MPQIIDKWEDLSWGERAKRLFHNRGMPLDEIGKAISICYGKSHLPESCEECPMHQNGCTDHMEVLLYELLKKIDTEEGRKLIRNFDVCFSGGLPDRCWKCDFKGDACSKNKILQAWNLIKKMEEKKNG